jgi:starch synthase (maltosyl-transferring)
MNDQQTTRARGADRSPPPASRPRPVVQRVSPSVDGGSHPIKRVRGDVLRVEAEILVDGHDKLAAVALVRAPGASEVRELPLSPVGNDRWVAEIPLDAIGRWHYTVEAWVDAFATWRWGTSRKVDAGQDVGLELLEAAALVAAASTRARGEDAERLAGLARELAAAGPAAGRIAVALGEPLATRLAAWPDRSLAARFAPELEVVVEPRLAQFSAWYEMFPRSAGPAGRHGTFRDVEARLPYVADMGFDVLYFPPIHPIGRTHRKGPNNSLESGPDDPGSPWAIGGKEGGHMAVHPELGTLDDFRRLVDKARGVGLEVALDIAFQASPDHPYVREHPEWFTRRPDGSVQHAENPPKKYQDVYPFDFAGEGWRSLWNELADVFFFWIDQGVRVFRVDNPHTKPLRFWRWCLATIKERHPEVIFLSEAFTRPSLAQALAKVGFSQSYTYFTWRTGKRELEAYASELAGSELADFFRPNFWPTTPDILPEHLQFGTRGTFIARLVLAATLSPSYGIYGPPYELLERTARQGSEEYVDNEKYQLRHWDLERPDSLRPVIRRVNQVRRENPALQDIRGLAFHHTDNELLLAYSKTSADGSNVVLVIVNLDPRHRQSGWVELDLAALGVRADETFQLHDQLGDARYLWRDRRNYVELDPETMPAHVFRVRRRTHTEQTFEYFL